MTVAVAACCGQTEPGQAQPLGQAESLESQANNQSKVDAVAAWTCRMKKHGWAWAVGVGACTGSAQVCVVSRLCHK